MIPKCAAGSFGPESPFSLRNAVTLDPRTSLLYSERAPTLAKGAQPWGLHPTPTAGHSRFTAHDGFCLKLGALCDKLCSLISQIAYILR